ncbi:MAG: class I SAM-dependent methyltransferase [Chloroflexi bacterium]|nr:class I SAM-dependent methyltransferase [Chloroflexota bacterium]
MTNKAFRDDLRKAYDLNAQQRDSGATEDWKIQERAKVLSMLQREDKRSLLEIGAGPGRDSRFFQDQGFDVVCIDLSPEMVRLCRKKKLNARVMDMTDLQFSANSFDAVYALNSLLHLTKAELPAVLNKISEIMKPSGLFYLGIYGGYEFEGVWEDDKYVPKRFFSYYSDDHTLQLVTTVFDILSFYPVMTSRQANLHFQSLILRKRNK